MTTEAREDKSAVPYAHAAGDAAFGQLGDKAQETSRFVCSSTKKSARKHLRRWPTKRGITCFRLYERDIPEIPMVVDRYEDHLHLSEYERPHDRDPAQHAKLAGVDGKKLLRKRLRYQAKNVHLKRRGRQTRALPARKARRIG